MFSPPAWGWSGPWVQGSIDVGVLPTRVGMVPWALLMEAARHGSPHPRGDGPNAHRAVGVMRMFSPPAWGWSYHRCSPGLQCLVLPTRVGMVRAGQTGQQIVWGSPHPRGDGPFKGRTLSIQLEFSPPAWGWSVGGQRLYGPNEVLPTRVGMVLAIRDV